MEIWTIIWGVLAALLGIWLVLAAIAFYMGFRRGGGGIQWLMYGLFMGPVAIYLALKLVQPCPKCQAPVLRTVTTCPRCGGDVPRLDQDKNEMGPMWTYRRHW
ncbi:MAG: hypothetical protein GKR89_23255 [Candidatus Latescibacteria bacterium]|nr:hypothetical protein [Candidatus Latescibacterota bacterium]